MDNPYPSLDNNSKRDSQSRVEILWRDKETCSVTHPTSWTVASCHHDHGLRDHGLRVDHGLSSDHGGVVGRVHGWGRLVGRLPLGLETNSRVLVVGWRRPCGEDFVSEAFV